MANTHRLSLTAGQAFTHYIPVAFLLFVGIVAGWGSELSIPFFLLSIIAGIIQYRRLRFREIIVSYTDEQLQEAVTRTAKELEWRIERNNKSLLRAHRASNWTGSWGEMITVRKLKGTLLINSICSPDSKASIASYGWNKKNVEVFLRNLNDVLNNKPASVIASKVETEWSFKNSLLRLLLYPLSISLIVLGGYFLSHPIGSERSVFAALIAMALACVYLYSDIKILATKKKHADMP